MADDAGTPLVAAIVAGEEVPMTETTTEDAGRHRFDGPDCGYGGWCEREVGHIGDHAVSSMPWDARQREARNALRAELRAWVEGLMVCGRLPRAQWGDHDYGLGGDDALVHRAAVRDLIGEDES